MQQQVVLFPITIDELIDKIVVAVKADVEKTLERSLQNQDVRWITQAEACERLRCSTYTFKEHLKHVKIDVHRIGNSIRYREDQVLQLPKIN